jgi:hypothetical protein
VDILYKLADTFFFVFHICLIFFNLFGWIFKPLRKWNLVTLSLTAFSWFVLGAFYGFGFCFLTDWHWHIREKLGYANPYHSYIQFLVVTVFSIAVSEQLINFLTATFFFAALMMSIITNFQVFKKTNR